MMLADHVLLCGNCILFHLVKMTHLMKAYLKKVWLELMPNQEKEFQHRCQKMVSFFMFCFSVCVSFVLYLLHTIYFLLLFKLLVVKLDVQDLKLHFFFALNARGNATSHVTMTHGSPACHVVGNTLAVTLLLTQMSNW